MAVSAGDWESVTFAVKFDVPAVGGVPLIKPPELKERPFGNDPPSRDHA